VSVRSILAITRATSVDVSGCLFENLTSTGSGMGIYTNSSVTVRESNFTRCASGADGGGLYLDTRSQFQLSDIVVTKCTAMKCGVDGVVV
jgi:hypothetical protein